MGNWGKKDRTESTGMFVNKEGLFQFKIVHAMDSIAIPEYLAKWKNKFRQLVFSAEVISEGDMKGKIMSWRYNLKPDNENSIKAVLRHIESLFNVTLDGDDEEALDMAPFIGRIFMAHPKARDIGSEDEAKMRVKLMWFDPDNPDADYGDFIFDEKIVAANNSAVIQPGKNDTSQAYWDVTEAASSKRKDKGVRTPVTAGGDDDEPLPF